MVTTVVRFGIAALLTAFVMPTFYIQAALSFQASRSVQITTAFLFATAGVAILLLVWDLDKESAWFRQPWLVAGIVAALWFVGNVVSFPQTVETASGSTTGPALLFALSSLWAPALAWLPIWTFNAPAKLILLGGLFVLQGAYPVAYMAKLTGVGGEHPILVYRRFQEPPPSRRAGERRLPREEIVAREESPPLPDEKPTKSPGSARWSVYSPDNKHATLTSRPGGDATVEILSGAAELWNVQLSYAPISVQKDQKVSIAFRIRSEAARLIQVAFSENHEPWKDLGLPAESLDIGPQWKEFRRSFPAKATDGNARVQLLLGGDPTKIEVAAVQISTESAASAPPTPEPKPPTQPSPSPAPPTPSPAPLVAASELPPLPQGAGMDPVGWTVFLDAGVPATWSYDSKAKVYRAVIHGAGAQRGHQVQLHRPDQRIESGKRYVVRLVARSTVERMVNVGVASLEPPFASAGLNRAVPLSPDWIALEIQFTATAGGNCRLHLDAGGPASEVDIATLTLEEAK